MNTRTYIENILKCKEFLEETSNYATLVKALTYLVDNIDFVDQYIDEDNPFRQHFYDFLSADQLKYDECFSLQEDIIIFFREKLLRLGVKNMNSTELDVLREFESIEHAEDSCVAKWYYEKLPLMIYSELGESVGNTGPNGKTRVKSL